MSRPSHNEAKEPPKGEWTVVYERPFPERIIRAFGWAAIATGTLVAAAGCVAAAGPLSRGAVNDAVAWVCFSLAVAPIIALPVYGLGMAIGGIYRMTRPKTYVVEWHEPDTYGRRILPFLIFFGILLAQASLFAIATKLH